MRTTLACLAAMAAAMLSGCSAPPDTKPAEPAKAKEAPKTTEAPETKEAAKTPEKAKQVTPATVPPGDWFQMFDGKSLNGWKVLKEDSFSLAGKVEVKDGAIVLGEGMPFTGIQWEGDFPKEEFEVRWDGCRQNGIDIFGGLTVPVGDSHVTFVCGGWGDSVVGLSSIDDRNASDNEQTKIMSFKNNQWHEFRLRVTKAKIEAWVGDKQVVDLERGTHKFTIYDELLPCRPLGFFSWSTQGAVRNIEMQRLKPAP
ncbi:MAG TPA: DUF1080 domain-containing protein [Planctomycetota bacterium]|nr:DUF1080 domain-containing protein [Planctomycetota bacterium]HRR80562.1 DUF1080 domain-containing protein [Planctomycetota bacterium]HRT96247.1 DUF1080 domain-containing protein [Planctomycetota bacterium]